MRAQAWLGVALASLAVVACAADSSDEGSPTCSGSEPIECRSDQGTLVGCCPESHPVCSPKGDECHEWGSVGGGGGAPGGGGSSSGGGGSPSGGGGIPSGGGGIPSGGSGGKGGTGGGTGATGGTAATGGAGGTGGTGATGGTGGTGGSTCADPNEKNDTQATAVNLGTIDDCDGSGSTVSATVDGASDVDFFSFFGTDTSSCVVTPVASTIAKVRLCIFAECTSAQVSCASGTATTLSGSGLPGCCQPAGGKVEMNLDCSGWTDNATVYVRVDQGPANQCQNYLVNYNY